MKAYVQGPDGEEVVLDINEPDPEDGTYVGTLPAGIKWADIPEDSWIRIVPGE